MRYATTVNLIVKREGRFLLVKRARDDHHGDLWSIPGGTLEGEETPEEGLKREIREELHCEIVQMNRFCTKDTQYENLTVHSIYFTGEIQGHIELNEKELSEYDWFTKRELEDLSIAFNQKDILREVG